MGAAIAAAFAENFDNPDMPQYAKAIEYIDAFTGYVSVLDDEMGSPVGDSTTFVMGKYGAPLTASNPNMTAYVQIADCPDTRPLICKLKLHSGFSKGLPFKKAGLFLCPR